MQAESTLVKPLSLEALAEEISRRREGSDRRPFVLFLGTECARAARVDPESVAKGLRPVLDELPDRPTTESSDESRQALAAGSMGEPASGSGDAVLLAVRGIERLRLPPWAQRILNWIRHRAPGNDASTEGRVLSEFWTLLDAITEPQRYRLLETYYDVAPVPSFYQDIALLLYAGYFSVVLTTNVDTLLEQALVGAGLRLGLDFGVNSAGSAALGEGANSRIQILKLTGDVERRQVETTEDIANLVKLCVGSSNGGFAYDILVVGFDEEAEAVSRWLSSTPGGQLWWASARTQPPPGPSEIGDAMRPIVALDVSTLGPDRFFGRLAYSLFHPAQGELRGLATTAAPGSSGSTDADYLLRQIRRSRAVLHSLEQTVIPGESDPRVQAQIDYEINLIARLEDEYRDLPTNGQAMQSLMTRIIAHAERGGTSARALTFLRQQLKVVADEYQFEHRDQRVVAAAVSATVMLATRLAPDGIPRELVRQLAAFVEGPSGWAI